MLTQDRIVVQHESEISTVTLNCPERQNAFDPELLSEFTERLAEVDREPSTNAVVVTGSGDVFTIGVDQQAFDSQPDSRVQAGVWHLIYRMLELEKPLVAMVNGPALGLGLAIVGLSDCSVMAEDAVIGDPSVTLGIPSASSMVLPLLIGPQQAKEMLLTGRSVTGAEAAALGLVNRAAPRKSLAAATYALASSLAAQPAYAARATKLVVNRHVRWLANQSLDVSLAYGEIARQLAADEGR